MVERINFAPFAQIGGFDDQNRQIAKMLDAGALSRDQIGKIHADLDTLHERAQQELTRKTDHLVQVAAQPILAEMQSNYRKLGEKTIDLDVDDLTEAAEDAWRSHAPPKTINSLRESILEYRLNHRLSTENEWMLKLAEAFLVKAEVPDTHVQVGKPCMFYDGPLQAVEPPSMPPVDAAQLAMGLCDLGHELFNSKIESAAKYFQSLDPIHQQKIYDLFLQIVERDEMEGVVDNGDMLATIGYDKEEQSFGVISYDLLLQTTRAVIGYANHLVGNPIIPSKEEIEQMYNVKIDEL